MVGWSLSAKSKWNDEPSVVIKQMNIWFEKVTKPEADVIYFSYMLTFHYQNFYLNGKEIFDVRSESYGEGVGYKRIWSVNVNMRNMITRLIWWTSKRIHKHKDESLNKYQVSLINALFTTDLLILKRSNLSVKILTIVTNNNLVKAVDTKHLVWIRVCSIFVRR